MLIVLRGLPASGKSTWARSFVAEDPSNRLALSRDGLRSMFADRDDAPFGCAEDEVTDIQKYAVRSMLKRGKTVLVDDTNLPHRRVREWLAMAEEQSVKWYVEDFTTVSVEECLRRNVLRQRQVPEEVIRGMHQKFIKGGRAAPNEWLPTRGSKHVTGEPYVRPPGAPEAVIVDIDGTVADMEGIRGPFDFRCVGEDRPKQAIIDYVRMHHAVGRKVIFMSGRLESCRQETEAWLREHVGVPYEALHMRPRSRPRTKDTVVKLDLFDEYVRDRYTIHSVLDDRSSVVDMWRSLGLTALQVAPGDF